MSDIGDTLPTNPALLAEPHRPFIHRDMSWLQFNDRVLSEAKDKGNPLLERVKFLAISASNLDEFFMIRFASLRASISHARRSGATSLQENLIRIRDSILESTNEFVKKQASTLEVLQKELAVKKVHILRGEYNRAEHRQMGQTIFENDIWPLVQQQGKQPLSEMGGLENLQMGVIFDTGAFFPIPRALPNVFVRKEEGAGKTWVFFLDDLLLQFLPTKIEFDGEVGMVRITRDGDLPIEMESEDITSIPDKIRTSLKSREKGRVVRIQYRGELCQEMLPEIVSFFRVDVAQAIPAPHTFCLHGLWTLLRNLDFPAGSPLIFPHYKPYVPEVFSRGYEIFDYLKNRDLLLHHPYDSFDAYVEWIRIACEDPQVEMIQQTVYRMDTLSPVIDHLKNAAAKKRVRVVIELRARFDELNNLRLADELRQAGVEVAFGFGRLKLHAKVALVSRREGDKLVNYTHLSTGNYNAATARQYEDLAILTAQPDFGSDARHFFDQVSVGKIPSAFRKLVSAPTNLHKRINALIEEETQAAREGRPARIVAKVNALVDHSVVEKLYQASQAGVQIDLIVRGACALIPGVPGLSENIRVMSVVDRFLEHSRIYYFSHSRALYLSSADWMPRNFFSRLELAFPIVDQTNYKFIEDIVLSAYLCDTGHSKKLLPQGVWKTRSGSDINMRWRNRLTSIWGTQPIRCQFFFLELARQRYKGTELEMD